MPSPCAFTPRLHPVPHPVPPPPQHARPTEKGTAKKMGAYVMKTCFQVRGQERARGKGGRRVACLAQQGQVAPSYVANALPKPRLALQASVILFLTPLGEPSSKTRP